MVVNEDDASLTPRDALRFIASKLAPTGNPFQPADRIAYEKPGAHH
jgi:hypothetical protein